MPRLRTWLDANPSRALAAALAALLGLCLLAFFNQLGSLGLLDKTEGLFVEVPRQMVLSGVAVQLLITQLFMALWGLGFEQALPIGVISAASSNYLINNALTFRFARLKGCLLYTSPSPRDVEESRMPSSA